MSIFESIRELFYSQSAPSESLQEKRNRIRIKCSFNVLCRNTEEAMTGKVYEMGLEGMRVEMPRRVKLGARFGVELKQVAVPSAALEYDEPIVWAEVMWCRKKRYSSTLLVGMKYLDGRDKLERSWVRYIFKRLGIELKGVFQKRQYIRADADVTVRYAQGAAAPEEAHLLNIGIGGALIETPLPVSTSNEIRLLIGPRAGIPLAQCSGEVLQMKKEPGVRRWSVGIRFKELTPRQMRLIGRHVLKFLKE